jgi:hypothetical protein
MTSGDAFPDSPRVAHIGAGRFHFWAAQRATKPGWDTRLAALIAGSTSASAGFVATRVIGDRLFKRPPSEWCTGGLGAHRRLLRHTRDPLTKKQIILDN